MSAKPYDARTLAMVRRVLAMELRHYRAVYGNSRVVEDREFLHAAELVIRNIRTARNLEIGAARKKAKGTP